MLAWAGVRSISAAISPAGNSGAVAALMGAFLVRFPKIKIEMMWVFALIRRRRFHAPAYWLLPLWLLTEVFYGSISGEGGGVAHWAHVGGFLFGAVVALALRFSGVEHKVNASIEKQIGRTGDPEMDQAHEYLDHGQIELAVAVLQSYTTAKPAAFEAWNLLRDVYWQKRDMAAFQQAALKCCDLHLKARDEEAAWRDYEDFVNSGGKDLPPRIWLDLCRVLENQSNYEAALGEYKKLAATHPADRQALLAQLAAGRLCMKKLSRPKDALKFYEAAETSTVPHLDLEQTIESAIHEAKAVLSFMASNAERNAATARPAAP